MTDRVNAIVVILEDDVRDDSRYLENLLLSIKMNRGVLDVQPHVSDGVVEEVVSRTRIRLEIHAELLEMAKKVLEKT